VNRDKISPNSSGSTGLTRFISTRANDFTAEFTHAFGQVLDFQQWVDSHGEYARHLMPGISSPRGLLIMGRRYDLTEENRLKLRRFSANCISIDVLTFDDLLGNASSLYESILRKVSRREQNMILQAKPAPQI
jgi:hypothetical protein